MTITENLFLFLHLLAAFWYVTGLAAVQLSFIPAWRSEELSVQAPAIEEASHYQGVLLIPGAIALGFTGVFLWAELDYNLIATGWLALLEGLYIVTLLVCLPMIGLSLRRARLAALKARRTAGADSELQQVLADNVPLVFGGLATILVPVMTLVSVFRPF